MVRTLESSYDFAFVNGNKVVSDAFEYVDSARVLRWIGVVVDYFMGGWKDVWVWSGGRDV